MMDFIPASKDTKVVVRSVKGYNGAWRDVEGVIYIRGRHPGWKLKDMVIGMIDNGMQMIVDARIEVECVGIGDTAMISNIQ